MIFSLTILSFSEGNINITNSCKDVSVVKMEYKKHKAYSGSEVYGITYGLKNNSKNIKKYKVIAYPKDKDGNKINESTIGSGTLKAHYEKPFNTGTYYSIGENMTSFSGDVDLEILCDQVKIKNTFTLNKSAFKMFKDKSDFEAAIGTGVILKMIDAHGGMDKFMDTVKPCLESKK